jgi:hypothetical protein
VAVGFLVARAADLAAVPVAGFFEAGAGNAFCCGFCAGAGKAFGFDCSGGRYMGWLKAILPAVGVPLRPRGLLAVPTLEPGAFV